MKTSRIALIHATPIAIEPIRAAFTQLWPEARVTHMLEDSLAPDLAAAGRIGGRMTDRFTALASVAVLDGGRCRADPGTSGTQGRYEATLGRSALKADAARELRAHARA